MKKLFLFTFYILLATNAFSQEKVFEYDPVGVEPNRSITASFQISNPTDSSKAIFIIETNSIHGLFCDKNFQVLKKIVFNQDMKECCSYLGYSIQDKKCHLLFVSRNKKDLYSVCFDPDKDIAVGSIVSFMNPESITEDFYISDIIHSSCLHLLYISRNSSIVKLYKIQSPNKVVYQEFDLSAYQNLYNRTGNKNLFELFRFPRAISLSDRKIASYKSDIFYDLDQTFYPTKVYSYQNHIILTLDADNSGTIILDIDSDKDTAILKRIDHSFAGKPEKSKTKSASYYYQNALLQVKSSKKSMAFSVHDVTSESLLAFYKLDKNSAEIPFVNLPFIAEGKGLRAQEYDSPRKTLRRLWKVTPSLSAYSFNDTLEIKFGGYKYFSGGMSLSEYAFIYSIGLFDPLSFNHLEGKVIPNPFIDMYELSHRRMDLISGETKFQAGENFYYGFFDKQNHKYFLYKFD